MPIFLGIPNFYWHYIWKFYWIVALLTLILKTFWLKLLKKNWRFVGEDNHYDRERNNNTADEAQSLANSWPKLYANLSRNC